MNLEDVVLFLLEHNVNIEICDLYGKTVCDIAKILKHNNILKILLDHMNAA